MSDRVRLFSAWVRCGAFAFVALASTIVAGAATADVASTGPQAAASAQAAAATASGVPPIVDRELFFGDPEISGAQLSPDGKWMAFSKPLNGTRNIWVKTVSEPFEKARPMTADTRRPIPAFFWSRDSRFILFVQDQAGDENYNVFAVNPAEVPASGAEVPAARNLTAAKGGRAFIYAVPRSDPDVIYVGLNDRDPAWHDLYKVKISTGERTLLRENTDRLTGWVLDRKDQLRLATRAADNGDTEVLRVEPDGFTKIYSCSVFETCAPVMFQEDGVRAYMITNKGDVDLTRLVLFNVESGGEALVESDPDKRVDFGGAVFSEKTNALLATTYEDDRTRVYFRDASFEADYRLVERQLPGRDLTFRSPTDDERFWIVSAGSDLEPGEAYVFDRQSKKLSFQYRVWDKLPREALATMTAIRYPSSDGLEIPAFLTLPKGVPARSLPLIVFPHGGPWARDAWGYDSAAQFLANRGYAVLQPNFRGSTGYGKRFLDRGNLEWGQKMQDDLTWGVKHLVARGIADPRRVGIMGGSYGGYATLAGVAFTPEVYAAAVSIVGPSNLITLLDSIPPYWEPARQLFYRRMGDPRTPEGRAQLERQSPLTAASKIRTPLLVIQGANDPRVKKAESDQIVVALRDRGFPVAYIVAPDEGHGFARPVNSMAMFAAAEEFLAGHLGGRFQQSMTPEVATRLKEITVDPKTVEMPTRVIVSDAAPTPAVDLKPMSATYAARIEVGGQKMADLAMTTEIAEEGGDWVITDRMKSPMGEAVDSVVLEKKTLRLKKRSATQGPMGLQYDFKDGRVTGEAKMGAEPKRIDVEVGHALFADGAGAYDVMATLPLAEGYEVTFRNFDVLSQKPKAMQLKVTGTESATVPAGTFDCFKVEVSSPDDGQRSTFWVTRDTRRVVKLVSVMPRMNGATLVSELQP